MVSYQVSGAILEADASVSTAPLIVLFERDDAVAVPLLSQLRLASYDVRASRTPVELFDILSKHLTALVLVDLGNATAGRREFWIALDAHRRGRSTQVMTFRFVAQGSLFDADFEPSVRALADVEVHGAQEFHLVIDGVRQRVPAHGGGAASGPHRFAGPPASSYPGGMAPIGVALGVPSPYMHSGYGGGGGASYAPAPFGQPPLPSAVPHYDPAGGYGSPQSPYDQRFGAQAFNPFAASGPGYQPGFAMSGSPYSPPAFPSVPSVPSALYSPSPPDSGPFPGAPQPGFMMPDVALAPSPFAQPFDANPYPAGGEQSPFAQPYGANPFADVAAENNLPGLASAGFSSGGGWATSALGAAPSLAQSAIAGPWNPAAPRADGSGLGHSPYDHWNDGNARATVAGQGPAFANGYATSAVPGSGALGASSVGPSPFGSDALREPSRELVPRAFSDVWTPPDGGLDSGRDGGLDGETGVVPEMAFKPVSGSRTETAPYTRSPSAEPQAHTYERPASGTLYTQQSTAPVPTPSRLPAIRNEHPADRALGSVLVEGALLTPNKLEVLKGIQQMLASVDMSFRLGELALLFKFLSPDQLLAALLVSRGLVSPQQIAGLGRVKQELAGSGMDYDLEALLLMFHILPPEQLERLRAELD